MVYIFNSYSYSPLGAADHPRRAFSFTTGSYTRYVLIATSRPSRQEVFTGTQWFVGRLGEISRSELHRNLLIFITQPPFQCAGAGAGVVLLSHCRTPKLIMSSLAIHLLFSSIYDRTKVQTDESTVMFYRQIWSDQLSNNTISVFT